MSELSLNGIGWIAILVRQWHSGFTLAHRPPDTVISLVALIRFASIYFDSWQLLTIVETNGNTKIFSLVVYVPSTKVIRTWDMNNE